MGNIRSEDYVLNVVQNLAQRCLTALTQEHQTRQVGDVEDALLERDSDGNPVGALPYTDSAITGLENLYGSDPEDVRLLHHLAIACHSRAWDWELRGDARSSSGWIQALDYWRRLQTNREFWDSLAERYKKISPSEFDGSWLVSVRRNLLDQLLDLHADFICSYCETGQPRRAMSHVDILRKAKIPPVSREHLLRKVFTSLTAPVSEARAQHAYEPALDAVERFLTLFPDYLPALRLHAEVSVGYLSKLSYIEDWELIGKVGRRVVPHARHLAAHGQLDVDPLAKVALLDLANRLSLLGSNRGWYFLGEEAAVSRLDIADEALRLGVDWIQMVHQNGIADSTATELLVGCLKGRTKVIHERIHCGAIGREQSIDLYQEALALITQAVRLDPGDQKIRTNFLEPLERELAGLDDESARWPSQGGLE